MPTYEVLAKVRNPSGVRFQRLSVRANNPRMAEQWAKDDVCKISNEKVEILFIQSQKETEKWNELNGFKQLPIERMQSLHKVVATLSEQEAKVLHAMLCHRLKVPIKAA